MSKRKVLSDEQIAKLKEKIRKAIKLYIQNNTEKKKTSSYDPILEQIIAIGVSFGLISEIMNYTLRKKCVQILENTNSIDDAVNQIYDELNSDNRSEIDWEAAVEEVLENAPINSYDDEWDMEL
ncbi:MAG: hypothetical protein NC124_03175 [Clostridium sp.]|nr:hypothetical protein [Clostridium sp.]